MNPAMVPDATQMKGYLAKGLTQQQIVEQYEKDTGIRVSRAAIGLAIARYGLQSSKPRPNHSDLIPWELRPEHRSKRDAKMLRLEGRRRKGLPMTERDLRWLTTWLSELQDANAVVHYNPDTTQGFWWLHRTPEDGDSLTRAPENARA